VILLHGVGAPATDESERALVFYVWACFAHVNPQRDESEGRRNINEQENARSVIGYYLVSTKRNAIRPWKGEGVDGETVPAGLIKLTRPGDHPCCKQWILYGGRGT